MAFSPETWVLLIGKIRKLQEEIDSLSNALHWLGVTTTPITDGQDANPIVVDGHSITVYNGDVTAYGGAEFVYDGSSWQQFGRDDSTYIMRANLLQTTGQAVDNVMSQKASTDYFGEKRASFTLSTTWTGASSPYSQTVSISGIILSATAKIELLLTATQINQLVSDGVSSLIAENDNGTCTIYAIGAVPSVAMNITCIVSETIA